MFPKYSLLTTLLYPIQYALGQIDVTTATPTLRPTTRAPSTNAPITNAPITNAPITNTPITSQPIPRPTIQPSRRAPTASPLTPSSFAPSFTPSAVPHTFVPTFPNHTSSPHHTLAPAIATLTPTALAIAAESSLPWGAIAGGVAGAGLGLLGLGVTAYCVCQYRKKQSAAANPQKKRLLSLNAERDHYYENNDLIEDEYSNPLIEDEYSNPLEEKCETVDPFFHEDGLFLKRPRSFTENFVKPQACSDISFILIQCVNDNGTLAENFPLLRKHLIKLSKQSESKMNPRHTHYLKSEITRLCRRDANDPISQTLNQKGLVLMEAFEKLLKPKSRWNKTTTTLNNFLDSMPGYYLQVLICLLGGGTAVPGALLTLLGLGSSPAASAGLSFGGMMLNGVFNAAFVELPSVFADPLRDDQTLSGRQNSIRLLDILDKCIGANEEGINQQGYELLSVLMLLSNMSKLDRLAFRTNVIGATASALLATGAPHDFSANLGNFMSPTTELTLGVFLSVTNGLSTFISLNGAMEQRLFGLKKFCRTVNNLPSALCRFFWQFSNILMYIASLSMFFGYTPAGAELMNTELSTFIEQKASWVVSYCVVGLSNYSTYVQTVLAFHLFATACMNISRESISQASKKEKLAYFIITTIFSFFGMTMYYGIGASGMQDTWQDLSPLFRNNTIQGGNTTGYDGPAFLPPLVGAACGTVNTVGGLFSAPVLIDALKRMSAHCRCCKPNAVVQNYSHLNDSASHSSGDDLYDDSSDSDSDSSSDSIDLP